MLSCARVSGVRALVSVRFARVCRASVVFAAHSSLLAVCVGLQCVPRSVVGVDVAATASAVGKGGPVVGCVRIVRAVLVAVFVVLLVGVWGTRKRLLRVARRSWHSGGLMPGRCTLRTCVVLRIFGIAVHWCMNLSGTGCIAGT